MGTPSNNHPAFKALKDRAADKARVIDLNVFKKTKEMYGTGWRVPPKELRSVKNPKDDISQSEKIHQATMIREPKSDS